MIRKPKKNQEILDFIEDTKKILNDNAKNFGLYVKLYKGYGKEKIQEAVKISLKNKNVSEKDKFRYFMGILKKVETPEIKEKSATINQDNIDLYKKMRSQLKKKMTPKIQKRAGVYSKILHKIAKEERKERN